VIFNNTNQSQKEKLYRNALRALTRDRNLPKQTHLRVIAASPSSTRQCSDTPYVVMRNGDVPSDRIDRLKWISRHEGQHVHILISMCIMCTCGMRASSLRWATRCKTKTHVIIHHKIGSSDIHPVHPRMWCTCACTPHEVLVEQMLLFVCSGFILAIPVGIFGFSHLLPNTCSFRHVLVEKLNISLLSLLFLVPRGCLHTWSPIYLRTYKNRCIA